MTRSTLSPRLFFGSAATLALSTMLPWVTVSGEHALAGVGWQTKLSSGGVVYLLLFAAAYAGAGHALRQQREVRRWAVGMWVVNGWMALNVIVLASQVKGR